MAIKFKIISRGEPGVAGGGNKKHYASAVADGEQDLDGLTRQIEKISTVSGADIRAVLYATVDVMIESLQNGRIVRLGDLGSLRTSISSEGYLDEKDVSASSIKSSRVIFSPGKRIKEMLKIVKFQKI